MTEQKSKNPLTTLRKQILLKEDDKTQKDLSVLRGMFFPMLSED